MIESALLNIKAELVTTDTETRLYQALDRDETNALVDFFLKIDIATLLPLVGDPRKALATKDGIDKVLWAISKGIGRGIYSPTELDNLKIVNNTAYATPDSANHDESPESLVRLLGEAGLTYQEAATLLGISEQLMHAYTLDTTRPGALPAPYPVQFALECLVKKRYVEKLKLELNDHVAANTSRDGLSL